MPKPKVWWAVRTHSSHNHPLLVLPATTDIAMRHSDQLFSLYYHIDILLLRGAAWPTMNHERDEEVNLYSVLHDDDQGETRFGFFGFVGHNHHPNTRRGK
jgi:hypothetical protein